LFLGWHGKEKFGIFQRNILLVVWDGVFGESGIFFIFQRNNLLVVWDGVLGESGCLFSFMIW